MTNIEFFRRSRGWTLSRMAEFLGPGFTAGQLSLMESGRLRPSTRQLKRLREAFGADADRVLEPTVAADPVLAREQV